PENTEDYTWGDRTLRNIRCKTCGIFTHWDPLDPKPGARHGVNLRNFEPKILESVVVRRFDGVDTWTFLDETLSRRCRLTMSSSRHRFDTPSTWHVQLAMCLAT